MTKDLKHSWTVLSKSDTVPSLVYTESFTPKWPKGR